MNMEKLYTVDDVAEFTSLTSRTIRNYLKEGVLKGKKIGGQWRFTMDNISELLKDKNAVTEMINENDQNLIDFINGTNTDISGEIQVCTVADYYCQSVEYASLLSQNFSGITQKSNGDCCKYNFYYNAAEQKARYIFFGAPAFIAESMRTLQTVWEDINLNKGIFSGKAKNYFKGRPDYPVEFFDYLYGEFGMCKGSVLVDIGSGVGKVSKNFLERGSKVFCVEPNMDMRMVADESLGHYRHYVSIAKAAEDTGIKSNSIDYVVCGNSYDYFDRNLAKPEFARILKENGKVIITYYGQYNEVYKDEMDDLLSKYAVNSNNHIGQETRNYTCAFEDNKYYEKIFYRTFLENLDEFLDGCMSYSRAPKPGDENYEAYMEGLRQIFDKYSKDGKLENTFKLRCLIGKVDDLA